MPKKICPLKFTSTTLHADGHFDFEPCRCERKKCEWWSDAEEKCCVPMIKESIESLGGLIYLKKP